MRIYTLTKINCEVFYMDKPRSVMMKSLLLILALMLTLSSLLPALADGEMFRVNTSGGLRVRTAPNTNAWVITSLKKGTKVKGLESKGSWAKIQGKDGQIGYCSKKYLTAANKPISDPDDNAKSSGELCYIDSVKRVNVYSSATTSSRVKGRPRGGTVMRLISYKGNWGYVETYNEGNRGFIQLSKLKKY